MHGTGEILKRKSQFDFLRKFMQRKLFDVAIIGAGASGMVGAIVCARAGLNVLLLEGQKNCGQKILLSGGTHCNLTHRIVTEEDYGTENKRVVRNVLRAFTVEQTLRFFAEIGVKTVCKEDGNIFPSSNSSKTVLEALLKEMNKLSIPLEFSQKVKKLKFKNERFEILGESLFCQSRSVLLCTGGLSYPLTGSDGIGHFIAKSFGHRIVFTTPALTSLKTADTHWRSLTGIAFPVRLTFWDHQKKAAESEGPFLFTHWGFSGPAVLDVSRYWIRSRGLKGVQLTANFLPNETEEEFRRDLTSCMMQRPKAFLKTFLSGKLPERFIQTLLTKLRINDDLMLNQLKREDREKLIKALFYFPLNIHGAFGYEKSEVTAGGVSLDEVDSGTLESTLRPGLFFSGEILDADGRIGGFNLQWAWSSAIVAARGVIKKYREQRL